MADALGRGYAGLLNLDAPRHVTVFLSDFELPTSDVERLRAEISATPSQIHFFTVNSQILESFQNANIDIDRDYISLHVLVTSEETLQSANAAFSVIKRGDFTRLELPWRTAGFRPERASFLLDIVTSARYGEQDRLASRFFELLARRTPYSVSVATAGGLLSVQDTAPWFELAGRLHEGEQRILPGGEAAYVGSAIHGTFVVDGAILASAQRASAADVAAELMPVGSRLSEFPLTLDIRDGRVTSVLTENPCAGKFLELLDDESYREVTEVGISFNSACTRFVYDWPAASNEGRPGVHIALGGDPDPDADKSQAAANIHIDLMAATTEVHVNDALFLRTFA